MDVQITSINASGESVKSDVLTLQAASHPDAPATPTETAITQEEYSDSTLKIQVSWVEPANNGAAITGYQLWMSKQSLDFEMVYDGASRSDVLTYLVENQILRSTSYNFKVRAINRIGYSSFSPVLKSFAAVVPSTPLGFHHREAVVPVDPHKLTVENPALHQLFEQVKPYKLTNFGSVKTSHCNVKITRVVGVVV